jgi:hypothetical protein
MGLLEDILLAPWFGPAVGAIVVAALSAYLTLRGKIREKAWLVVYEEKRREIRALIKSMDDFASSIVIGTEIISWEEERPAAQVTNIMFMVRQKFGPGAEERDELPRAILGFLPDPSEMALDSPDVREKIALATRALRNVLEMELQDLIRQAGSLRTSLTLSARDPDLLRTAGEVLQWAYEEAHKNSETFEGVDADAFGEEWLTRTRPIKLGLRKDLSRSSLSLGAATHLSWRWRIKRSRTWKYLAKLLAVLRPTRVQPKP